MIAHVRRFDIVISKSWIPCFGWNAQLLSHDSRREEEEVSVYIELSKHLLELFKCEGMKRNRISHNTQVEQAIWLLSENLGSTSLHSSIIAHLFKKT